jgi:phosphoribosylaminoimidazole-succinocarboxamide synthase
LDDPMISEDFILADGLATPQEFEEIKEKALVINELLLEMFQRASILLVDFKLEFGRADGKVLLADEITPDGCRLWDADTLKKLDKDRFRRDLGGVEEAYIEVVSRLLPDFKKDTLL